MSERLLVQKGTLDLFESRNKRLWTEQVAVIVGKMDGRRPVEPYVKILCSGITGDPDLYFNVRAKQTAEDAEESILRCELELDEEGNVTGLKDNILSAWLNHGDQNYVFGYKVNTVRPDTADLVTTARRIDIDRYPPGYKSVTLDKLDFNPTDSGFPFSVDLIGTLDMYLGEQPLTVGGILASPLVPAAPSSL